MKDCKRCGWVSSDPLYQEYHDQEWGVPVYDDRKLFEFLILESAQAGLSWITILRKREHYRKAFADFDPVKVSKFNEAKVKQLMQNEGLVRNEKKIRAAIQNAKAFLKVVEEFGSFQAYSWNFIGNKPLINKWKHYKEAPAKTDISEAWSKDLKKRGFSFLGPVVLYAHMQAVGMVNDHSTDCFRYGAVKKLYR